MNDETNMIDPQKVPSTTPDLKTELAKKLQELVPEAIADGKVDTKKLQELLDDDTADESERFGLFWPGKKRAMRAAQEPTTATLKPVKEESKDWDTTQNIFIEGDNLEVLKILQKYYHNKIKMIYIDPPYNTGKDFVYPDNFKEGLQSYLEFTNQLDGEGKKVSTNSDTDGRYHSNWLNMMYPRLKLARNLLTDDGAIFISIDDNEQDNLKKICNEIFGEDNFVATIVRATGTTTGQGSDIVGNSYDYLLVYSRSSKFTAGGIDLTEKDISRYKFEDDRGKYSTLQLRRTGNGDRREDRPKMYYAITAPDGTEVYPTGPTGYESRWRVGRQTYEKMVTDNLVEWKNVKGIWTPYYKFHLEGRQKRLSNWWGDIEGNKKASIDVKGLLGERVFETPKPIELIARAAKLANTENKDIVLDFFSGSGTTAHSIMKLNADDGGQRHHIQVQLPEPTDNMSEAIKAGYKTVADISKERIRRAGEKIKVDYSDKLAERESPLDVGFKVFKLADTNFTKWKTSSETDDDKLQQHLLTMRDSSNDSATEEELLTELLIKLGVSLTTKIKPETIDDLNTWRVGDNLILGYLNEHVKPSLEQLRKIVDIKPTKLIILEDAFQGDDELKTNLSQICKTNKIELWTV